MEDETMNTSEDALDRVAARERSYHRGRHFRRARRTLVVHARVFAIVNAVLVGIWVGEIAFLDEPHTTWWLPVTLGWGAGLAVHAALVHRPWRRRPTANPRG